MIDRWMDGWIDGQIGTWFDVQICFHVVHSFTCSSINEILQSVQFFPVKIPLSQFWRQKLFSFCSRARQFFIRKTVQMKCLSLLFALVGGSEQVCQTIVAKHPNSSKIHCLVVTFSKMSINSDIHGISYNILHVQSYFFIPKHVLDVPINGQTF